MKTRYLNNIVCTQYSPAYKAHEEFTVSAVRPYCLTERGAQRMISNGTVDSDGYPEIDMRPNATVIRVEHNLIVNYGC